MHAPQHTVSTTRTHVLSLFYRPPLPLHERCSWAYYRCWLAECCFLPFQFSITYSGCKVTTTYWGCKVTRGRQEKRLSPGRINSPTSPDQNWTEACPQETWSSHCSSPGWVLQAPSIYAYPSAPSAPLPPTGRGEQLCLGFADHRVGTPAPHRTVAS